jgi:hypothetical protein
VFKPENILETPLIFVLKVEEINQHAIHLGARPDLNRLKYNSLLRNLTCVIARNMLLRRGDLSLTLEEIAALRCASFAMTLHCEFLFL